MTDGVFSQEKLIADSQPDCVHYVTRFKFENHCARSPLASSFVAIDELSKVSNSAIAVPTRTIARAMTTAALPIYLVENSLSLTTTIASLTREELPCLRCQQLAVFVSTPVVQCDTKHDGTT